MATGPDLGRGLQRSDPLPATASAVPASAEATWAVHDQSRDRTEGRRGAGSPGRRSGKIRHNALVKPSHNGNEYLVALAGESEWVRNVRAADGHVVIGRRERWAARLVEVPPSERPLILRAYLLRWGRQPNSPAVEREARLFFGVAGDPSVEDLAAIAEFYPMFRITFKESVLRD